VPLKRARLYDALALLVAIVAIVIDQWTKALVVQTMPLGSEKPFPILGQYFYLWYIRNSGAAFSMLSGNGGAIVLAMLIALAIIVVGYLYARMINNGPLAYKIVFGLIIGGALSNLIDRIRHGGYVVDFISFRIPEINYYFAIFNVADACISVGVVLLFLFVLFGGLKTSQRTEQQTVTDEQSTKSSSLKSPGLNIPHTTQTTEQDAQR
jgi:signal peptidase II